MTSGNNKGGGGISNIGKHEITRVVSQADHIPKYIIVKISRVE